MFYDVAFGTVLDVSFSSLDRSTTARHAPIPKMTGEMRCVSRLTVCLASVVYHTRPDRGRGVAGEG
jgi:hypothetical protein